MRPSRYVEWTVSTVEVQRQHSATDEIGGKDLYALVQYEGDSPFNPKDVIDVITTDGSVYRFSQLMDGDPWTWENRTTPDGDLSTRRSPLPKVVEAVLEVETNDDFIY